MPIKYRIEAMDCPVEQTMISDKLGPMPGIKSLGFNLLQRTLTVEADPGMRPAIEAGLKELGFEAVRLADVGPKAVPEPAPVVLAGAWILWAASFVLAVAAEVTGWAGWLEPWLPAGLALAALVLSGSKTYLKGWRALVHFNLNINALMSLAVTGALILQQWPEAAMVMVLFSLAEKIETLSLDRARRAIQGLVSLRSETARVAAGDGWQEVGVDEVKVGERLLVRPGEQFSHDGVIRLGTTAVDESTVTGEALPADKGPGAAVLAGSINLQGEIEVEVTALAKDSTLSRIIHLVEEAQMQRSPTQRFVDRFARWYTPLVVSLAVVVGAAGAVLFPGLWQEAVYRALVLLVIACPCALVIATPVTVVSGLTAAARQGVLIKGGVWLEAARHIDCLAFDKTGTLTEGRPSVQDWQFLPGHEAEACQAALDLASRSDHPLSRALMTWALDRGGAADECREFTAEAGLGLRGIRQGQTWYLGSRRYLEGRDLRLGSLTEFASEQEAAGRTVILAAGPMGAVAAWSVSDRLKPESQAAVSALHQSGVRTVILTGDLEPAARKIAAEAGITEVHSQLLPADKSDWVIRLKTQCRRVAMVGDGINDAPALARSDLGIAVGLGGTPAAIETADVVLMEGHLARLAWLVRLSRKTVRLLRQNIGLALGLKAGVFALTLAGAGSLWLAVLADTGTSLLVVANGLRLVHPRTVPLELR